MAPSPHQEGEVVVGFSQRRGLGLLESMKKLVMLLRRGEVTDRTLQACTAPTGSSGTRG